MFQGISTVHACRGFGDSSAALQVMYSAAHIIHLVLSQRSQLRQFPYSVFRLLTILLLVLYTEQWGVPATTGQSTGYYNIVMNSRCPLTGPMTTGAAEG